MKPIDTVKNGAWKKIKKGVETTQKAFKKLAKLKDWTSIVKSRSLQLYSRPEKHRVVLIFKEDERFTCECSPKNAKSVIKGRFKQI